MDFMTLFGLLGAAALLLFHIGRGSGDLSGFANLHGVIIVMGGTFFAVMVNSSFEEVWDCLKAGASIFFKPRFIPVDQAIPWVSQLAAKARKFGPLSIQNDGRDIEDDGFFAHAIEIALTSGDEKTARNTLEKEIKQIRARHYEVGNIFRTAGILSPMFGLLGTLIGIIQVLRSITDPETLGPAMSVAISSAFFGILLANLVFVPCAGKLRTRSNRELISKEVIAEGILDVVFSSRIPIMIETRLLSYLKSGKMKEEAEKGAAVTATNP